MKFQESRNKTFFSGKSHFTKVSEGRLRKIHLWPCSSCDHPSSPLPFSGDLWIVGGTRARLGVQCLFSFSTYEINGREIVGKKIGHLWDVLTLKGDGRQTIDTRSNFGIHLKSFGYEGSNEPRWSSVASWLSVDERAESFYGGFFSSKNTLYLKVFNKHVLREQYARHSRFRICMLKGSHGLLCMRYSSPKSADASGHEDIVRIFSDIVNCISACICTM